MKKPIDLTNTKLGDEIDKSNDVDRLFFEKNKNVDYYIRKALSMDEILSGCKEMLVLQIEKGVRIRMALNEKHLNFVKELSNKKNIDEKMKFYMNFLKNNFL